MKRKGSMQLSIEAIIILVIAFTLLGFGIVFVRNVFEKAGGNAAGALEGNACDTASSNKPFNPEVLKVDKGKSTRTNICVFNNANDKMTEGVLKIQSCMDPDGEPVTLGSEQPIDISSLAQDIERGEGMAYVATIKASGAAKIGSYICNVYVQKETPLATDPKIGPRQLTFEVQ